MLTLGQLATLPLIGLLFFTSQSYSAAVDAGERIVVFGDSLSDTGNTFRLTQGKYPDPEFSWNGRASNGPIWVDHLVRYLRAQVRDYAYSGATTNNVLVRGTVPGIQSVIPSILDQINEAYPREHSESEQREQRDDRTTQVIFGGANNYLSTILKGGNADDNLIRETVSSLIRAIETIRSRTNAQRFFIPNIPPLELTPAALKHPAHVRQALERAIQRHNELLERLVTQYQHQHPNIRVVLFDTHSYLRALIQHPREHDFENGRAACVNLVRKTKCANPDAYIFWDDDHLTSRAHEFLAKEILAKWSRS